MSEKLDNSTEIRVYQPRLAAQTKGGDSAAFRRLFRYISGENRAPDLSEGTKVAMTVPVEVSRAQEIAMTIPVETGEDDGAYMRFFLPREYSDESAPVPTDPAVSLVTVQGRTLAVLRFSGFGFDSSVEARKVDLLARLKESPWEAQGQPVALFYDPPWTLPFFRRNEVAVPVQRR